MAKSRVRCDDAGASHLVRVVDIPLVRVRRPVDLVLMISCFIAIVAVLALSVYARGTTSGVTHDVQSAFSTIVRSILLVPITVIEGLLTLVLPVVVIVERLIRRNPRAIIEAVSSAVVAYVTTAGLIWLVVESAPTRLIRSLQIWQDGSLSLSISPSVAALAALLTVTGTRSSNKAVQISWALLWIALAVSVITGDSTLIGSLVAVLFGRGIGLGVRYLSGVLSARAHGTALVDAIRRAGIDPVSVVRIGNEADSDQLQLENPSWPLPAGTAGTAGTARAAENLHPSGTGSAATTPVTDGDTPAGEWRSVWSLDSDQADTSAHTVQEILASTPDSATVTVEREGWNRVYAVEAADGQRWDAVVLDEDRQVIGLLSQAWMALQLRGMGRRSATNLRQAADRAALMSYAATAAGVNTPQLHGVAQTQASVVLVGEHIVGAHTVANLPDEAITDEVMAGTWQQLLRAHAAGLSHRNIVGESIMLVTEGERSGQIWLSGWEQGEIASPQLTQRIDLFQLLATFALRLGVDRAVQGAAQVLPEEELAALAPVVQRVALPPESQTAARWNKNVLRELRTALAAYLPDQGEMLEPLKLARFSARTVIMTTIALVAGWVLLTTLNFRDIAQRMSEAEPWWLVAAFGVSLLTYLGSAMGLEAFSPRKLGLWRTTLVQVAASVIALVAPAGVGPAAINLRFMQRRRVDTPMAVATVTLLQVSQFVTTVLLLIAIALFTGSSGALSQLPSQTIVVVLGAVVVVIGIMIAIPALRRIIAAKVMPTLRQVWPRVLWVVGQPSRLAMGIGGNLMMTIGFLAAFALTLKAFGHTLALTTLAIVFLSGTALGSAVPTPGGIGAVEGALSTGLRAAGIATATALSTAVVFRVLTFWMRVPLGWLALRHLQRKGDI